MMAWSWLISGVQCVSTTSQTGRAGVGRVRRAVDRSPRPRSNGGRGLRANGGRCGPAKGSPDRAERSDGPLPVWRMRNRVRSLNVPD